VPSKGQIFDPEDNPEADEILEDRDCVTPAWAVGIAIVFSLLVIALLIFLCSLFHQKEARKTNEASRNI